MITHYDKSYDKFLFAQRTRLLTEYQLNEHSTEQDIIDSLEIMAKKDFSMIERFLPEQCSEVLDIGCGLGLVDLYIHHHYNTDINFTLVDANDTIVDTHRIRGFNKNYVFYNSMSYVQQFLVNNGIRKDNLELVNIMTQKFVTEKKYDVILSFLACGWHFSIETYMDIFENNLSDNGVLILDIRNGTGQDLLLLPKFECVYLPNTNEMTHMGGVIGNRCIFKKRI